MAPAKTDPSAALRASILRSWIALERFETKTLDPPDRPGRRPRNARKFAVDIGPREPLPWEHGHPACGAPLSNDNVEWRHTLHIGQFDIGDGYERVEAQFPPDTSGRERRPPTRAPAPLLAMTVTTDGRPVMDSLQVSSAAWSIAQTLRLGIDDPKWLHGFDDALSELRGAFEKIVIDSAEPPKPIEPLSVVAAAAAATQQAPVRALSLLDDGPPDDHGAVSAATAADAALDGDDASAANAGGVDPDSDTEADVKEPGADSDFDDPRYIDAIDDDGIALAPITWDHLLRLFGAAKAILELDEQLVIRPVVRSTTWPESKRVPLGTGDTLLNSFAVEDLERIEWRLQDGEPGAALKRYLGATSIAEQEGGDRIDVDERLDLVREQLDPSKLPSGRWPADPSHDLALGQQLAVNLAMQTTSTAAPSLLGTAKFAPEQSILAVNGPPGTGKTTMLRDLIAALVTERADVIAGFSSADELFKGEALSVQGDRVVRVSKVSPKLTGREILLACATNAAAQNVSLELPDIGAVHAEWRGLGFDAGAGAGGVRAGAGRGGGAGSIAAGAPASARESASGRGATPAVGSIAFPGSTGPDKPPAPNFLADFATAALRTGAVADARFVQTGPDARPAPQLFGGDADAPTDPHELRAWGLIAARLGRRSYCKDFASAVWWGAAPWAGGRSSGGRGPKIAPTERAERGLAALLTSTQNADGRAAWEQSKERFLDAKDEVARIRRERQGMADALRPAIELEASFAQAQDDLAASTAELEQHEAARATAATRAAPLVIEQQAAKRRLEAAGPPPPGHTIARLSEPAKKKELARRAAEQEAALAHRYAEEALDEIRALQRQIEGAKTTAARAEFARDDARERLDARAEALAAATSAEGNASTEKGTFIVPDDAWEADQRTRDLRAPWSDEVWNRARTECFLAALDLHEATLLANGRDARRNLSVAIDLISGRVSGLTHDVVLAAWQTLFLLVPVISTTFASLPTMLSGLGQEDLGWLLIDEAGQAQPQQAAGAIWRCQRAVVVGDPHQIEPVSGLPTSLAEAIRERFEVPIECISPEASVQRLADAVMPWGGRRGEDDLWVGVPMNVHRRCEPVIFELVNAIAYGGRMVNATVPREAHPALRVETCWLDVPSGSGSEGHWIPAEGHRLDALLAHLGMNGYDFRQVFAVSPFREVAWQLRRRADDPRHRGMTGGTIHTIQGREADTVILVLGGDPTKPGARRWVSSTPNLLNVAASRARQRLYVIGDHDAWIDLPYFRQLGGLRRVAPPAARAGAR